MYGALGRLIVSVGVDYYLRRINMVCQHCVSDSPLRELTWSVMEKSLFRYGDPTDKTKQDP